MRLLILASGPGVHAHEDLVAVHAPGDLFHCHNINCDQYLYQLVTVEKNPHMAYMRTDPDFLLHPGLSPSNSI